jgi:hypothetical protein
VGHELLGGGVWARCVETGLEVGSGYEWDDKGDVTCVTHVIVCLSGFFSGILKGVDVVLFR